MKIKAIAANHAYLEDLLTDNNLTLVIQQHVYGETQNPRAYEASIQGMHPAMRRRNCREKVDEEMTGFGNHPQAAITSLLVSLSRHMRLKTHDRVAKRLVIKLPETITVRNWSGLLTEVNNALKADRDERRKQGATTR